MTYYNYHGIAKRMIRSGKLTGFYIADNYNGIRPALVLLFNDPLHPVMPIREYRWDEYTSLLEKYCPDKQL